MPVPQKSRRSMLVIVLAAMFQEQDPHAVYYLMNEGVTRLESFSTSHEISSGEETRKNRTT